MSQELDLKLAAAACSQPSQRIEICKRLLELGAKASEPYCPEGLTALIFHAAMSSGDTVALLARADPRAVAIASSNGHSALHFACAGANPLQNSLALLAAGADCARPNLFGQTPFDIAAASGSVELCETFLRHGSPQEASRQAAQSAKASGHDELAELIRFRISSMERHEIGRSIFTPDLRGIGARI